MPGMVYPWQNRQQQGGQNQQQEPPVGPPIGPSNPDQMANQQAESNTPQPQTQQDNQSDNSQQPQQTREEWRDSWMGLGRLTPQAADEWLKTHGARQVNSGSGVWQTPYGDTLDLQIGRKNALATGGTIQAGWTPIGGSSGGGSGGGQDMMGGYGMMGGPMAPQQSAQDKFMQMFGGTDKRLKSQGYSPS